MRNKTGQMRIAIIGNMNNNGFSLMRYFRDLGEDAHLFLYLNDGFGSLSHFKPESDTWDIKKWAPFIHSIGFSNTLSSLHGKTILFGLLIRKYFSRTKENNSILHYSPVNYKKLKETLNSFDKIICSGIAPAILYKAGIKTDIYYSYSTGIEFLGNLDVLKSTSHMKKLFIKISRKPILKGLKSSKYILNSDMSVSAQTLEKYKLSFLPLAIPMVYNQEAIAFNQTQKPAFIAIIKAINSADMAIMSPSRNQWIKPKNVKQEAWFESKHNDWLIKGFAKMLILRPACNAKLFLFNYGPDVEASKELIKKLNISKNIIWTDKTSRKEILLMLNYATVCVGEFRTEEKIIWGGTGWEALAAG